jgi:tetratricopeptide (TPR) repeat protein
MALLLPSVGSVQKIRPVAVAVPASDEDLRRLHVEAGTLMRSGRYAEAAEINRQGYRLARNRAASKWKARFLGNAGSCYYAALRYREAMEAYLGARKAAREAGDWSSEAGLAGNLSSLYLAMGEAVSAEQAIRAGLDMLERVGESPYRAQLLLQQARLCARRGDWDSAYPLFRDAIVAADRPGGDAIRAQAWNVLGYELLSRGDLDRADAALTEAFRLRRLNGNRGLGRSLLTLAQLRLRQGDLVSAGVLADRAVAASRDDEIAVAPWSFYYVRGQVLSAGGQVEDALADFRTALELARRWRLEVVPADALRTGTDVTLHEVYSAFISTAIRLHFRRPSSRHVQAAFEAAEENRAAGLRALVNEEGGWHGLLRPEYGEKLAELRRVENAMLAGTGGRMAARGGALAHLLTEMEAEAGLDFYLSRRPQPPAAQAPLLERTRQALAGDEALLSFHIADHESYLWAVTRSGLELHCLPGRARIVRRVEAFLEAIAASQGVEDTGLLLYRDLFGALGEAVTTRHRWLLAVEDVLFRVPFAALTLDGEPRRFLLERQAVRLLPSAHALDPTRNQAPEPAWTGRFVAVGDPIYNFADPRWKVRPAAANGSALELARLPGSGREVRACGRAWGSAAPVVLEGPAVSREALRAALRGEPAVLHLAAHVVRSNRPSGQGLIALGLLPNGQLDLLTPVEIMSWRARARLVVLSGCSSGLGEVLPGAGLMGLTRAFLAAGAGSVAGSLWPVPDDSGHLFSRFYRYLRSNGEVAAALQSAQLDLLRSRDENSSPKYWAAYYVVGKE